MNEMLERVAEAIERAQCKGREGPYGLYDYASYGHPKPHHVRDFRDPCSDTWGCAVLMTTDGAEARDAYERLTREHIARSAIEALRDIDAVGPQMLAAGRQTLYGCSEDPELDDARRCFQAMIDAALKDAQP